MPDLVKLDNIYSMAYIPKNLILVSMLSESKLEPAFSQNNIAVVFATDAHYAEIVSVAILSLVDYANTVDKSDNYDILLIADGLNEDQLHRITSIATGKPRISIRFLDAEPFKERSKAFHFHYLSAAAFYRLCLPSMLPEYEKVLYLDCDVLIKADIAEIYHTDLGDNLIAGVQDRAVQFLVHEWINDPLKKLKYNGLRKDMYFNSGVILMNLKQMRVEHTELLFKALSARTDLAWLDQDILNIAAKNCWIPLPDRWNHTLHMYLPFEISQEGSLWSSLLDGDAAIVHFACGSRKPWNFWSSRFEQDWWDVALRSPARDTFLHYLPVDEEQALLPMLAHSTLPELPECKSEEFAKVSAQRAKINYLQRVCKERNQQCPDSGREDRNQFLMIKQTPISITLNQAEMPLVTVITPTFNLLNAGRIDHFKQSVQSVRNQTYPHIEHLVIDGGSTDGTLEVLEEMRERGEIHFISEPDKGIYEAMNKGTLMAQGKYVAYLNTDDYWHNPEGLSMSVQILEKTNADFSYAPYTYLHPDGYMLKIQPALGAFLTRMSICHQAMVIRKDSLVSMGLYDENLKIAADYDYVVKVIKNKRPTALVPLDYTMFRMGGLCCTDVDTSYHECSVLLSRAFHGNAEWEPFFESFCRDQICPKEIFDDIRSQVSPEMQNMMDDMVQPLSPSSHTLRILPNPTKRIDSAATQHAIYQAAEQEPTKRVRNDWWVKLFGFVPFIKVKVRPSVDSPEKTVYKLFGVFPLLRIKRTVRRTSYYLFNILPIVKVK